MATVAGAFEDRTLPFDPMVVMTPMQIVTIRASRIAYSTAVGPSSRLMNSIDGAGQSTHGSPSRLTCCSSGDDRPAWILLNCRHPFSALGLN